MYPFAIAINGLEEQELKREEKEIDLTRGIDGSAVPVSPGSW